jgi:hypothetical protein
MLLHIANQPHLTDAKAEQFLNAYHHLEEVEVKNCGSLGNKTLRFLIDKYPTLQALGWIDNLLTSEEGFAHLIENSSLRALNVSGSLHFSSPLCRELLSRSTSLQSLDVSFCPLTDAAFSSIHAPLTFLNLQGCTEITDKTLQFLAKISTLKTVVLGLNKKLTPQGIDKLERLPMKIHRARNSRNE